MAKMVILKLLFSILLVFKDNAECRERIDPLVHTKNGLIRGLQATDGNYSMFLGIPYAKIDESNPFGPSLPHPIFENEYEAYDDTSKCPQIEDLTNNIVGSLDCLKLNIYVPNTATSSNKLPVMVFIHGGNFERGFAGRSRFGPKYLVRHDIILVVINYRVGLYGFMCLHTPKVPGNQSLKDLTAALRWIRDNIASFGGDTNKITVFGQSSGGKSLDFLIFSPQEQLFHNVILQSGTSLRPDTIYEADTEAHFKLSKHLGFATNSSDDALNFLAGVDPLLAVAAAAELNLVIKPCIEKDFDNVEKIISDYTINLGVPKSKQNISILIGHTAQEQVAMYADKDPRYFDNLNIIKKRLNDYFNFDDEYLNDMVKIVHRFYLGDDKISFDNMWQIIEFDSLFSYVSSTHRRINMFIENGARNIFYYIFSYVGGRNWFKDSRNVTVGGAGHADDLGYLFDMYMYPNDASPEDQLIIDRITTLWTNFAKFGNPTPTETDLLPIKWLPVTKDDQYYYNIDTNLALDKRPYHDESAFWELFFYMNWKLQKGYKEHD